MPDSALLLTTQSGRQRLLRLALNLTEGTSAAPQAAERKLLEQFVQGELSIDQVIEQVDQAPQGLDEAQQGIHGSTQEGPEGNRGQC